MHCNAEFYYIGKIQRTGIGPLKQRRVVEALSFTECTLSSSFIFVRYMAAPYAFIAFTLINLFNV